MTYSTLQGFQGDSHGDTLENINGARGNTSRMKRVLMPVNGEPDLLERQLNTLDRVLDSDDVEVTILYVHEEIDTPPDEAGDTVIDSINKNIESLQGIPQTIERAKTSLEEDGIPVAVVTTTGDPKSVIHGVAEEVAADVILVAARDRSPVGKAVFGSVTQNLILTGNWPVLVAK